MSRASGASCFKSSDFFLVGGGRYFSEAFSAAMGEHDKHAPCQFWTPAWPTTRAATLARGLLVRRAPSIARHSGFLVGSHHAAGSLPEDERHDGETRKASAERR